MTRLTDDGKNTFRQCDKFLHDKVDFTHPESLIHAVPHSERVLLYALILAESEMPGDDSAREILAHASVFHDTRRFDDYLDVGHGARAAVHYQEYCEKHPEMKFHPEAVYLMRYHDLDDKLGIQAIKKDFGTDADRVLKLYAIFKDADALDRWRLGSQGLDPKYLRTATAKGMTEFSHDVVKATMSPELLDEIDREVKRIIKAKG